VAIKVNEAALYRAAFSFLGCNLGIQACVIHQKEW
jgi:hypothetical protein